MIRRLYVHNFRCLENFELSIASQSSILLIGKNGSGKTTVGLSLEILQKIARGTNRVHDLVKSKDFTRGRSDIPIRFELEVELDGKIYEYGISFELAEGLKELRVLKESLISAGQPIYTRELAQVHLVKTHSAKEAKFLIDWYIVALPIVQQRSSKDPLGIFKEWLAHMLILRPIPSLINGESKDESLQPTPDVSNFGAWWAGLMAYDPSKYSSIDKYIRDLMPDLRDIKNPNVGPDARNLIVYFSNNQFASNGSSSLNVQFDDLSDGEKCFMICAMVIAANSAYGPLLCFWDEPDNYLALSEVGHFVLALRSAFQPGGQFIATSHNPEAIRRFSDQNTLMLTKQDHFTPTIVRRLSELQVSGDLIDALVRDDVYRG